MQKAFFKSLLKINVCYESYEQWYAVTARCAAYGSCLVTPCFSHHMYIYFWLGLCLLNRKDPDVPKGTLVKPALLEASLFLKLAFEKGVSE